MSNPEDMAPVPVAEVEVSDEFSRMVRDVLRAIDTRIERVVQKKVEAAMQEWKVNGREANEEAINDAISEYLRSNDIPDEDRVNYMISEALSECSVEFSHG